MGIKFTFPSIIISCAQVAVMDSSYFSSPKTAAELFPIKFHLPPSSTSSESSGSDTDCKAEATSGSSNLVPGISFFYQYLGQRHLLLVRNQMLAPL